MKSGTYVPDDLRVFIKDEPHKVAKIREGRLRLIMVMSLEDQMVDRLLMGTWAEEEKYWKVPGKTGWTPLPVGYRLFNSTFTGDVLATDCSSFDWTFPEWVAPCLLKMRLDMVKNPSEEYVKMLTARWEAVMKHAIVRLPDGTRFRQTRWGLMKSGWFRTIAENSSAQVLINALAWIRSHPNQPFPVLWTMGDDVIIDRPAAMDVPRFENALATTGILVKASSTNREFGGFRIEQGAVYPLYPHKHRYLLMYLDPSLKEQVAQAFQCLYSMVPKGELPPFLRKVTRWSPWTQRLANLWAVGAISLRDS